MQDLTKINSRQLYMLWRNLTIGLFSLIVVLAFCKLLPHYLSPIITLICAAGLYTLLFNNRRNSEASCMIIPYTIFFSLISYAFISIIINVLWIWGIIKSDMIPPEIIFFNDPFIASLYLMPCCMMTAIIMLIRGKNSALCKSCKLEKGSALERGKTGAVLSNETHNMMVNLVVIFSVLTVLIYCYYFFIYSNINVNARDHYIFTWMIIIVFILDEIYMIMRYINLYLDLKENDELITDEQLQDMSAKTYLRFYVVCGNYLFVDNNAVNPAEPYRKVIDTPFFTNRTLNGITAEEVRIIIERMTGYRGGELRFFFGRRTSDYANRSILRYFYFLDGTPEDYPDMRVDGNWMSFEHFKHLYAKAPGKMMPLALSDLSRLATIMLTEKTFNENGYRKNKLKSYTPNFTLEDVRKSELDFQDDKWIKISRFNSDTSFYGIKRWWKRMTGSKAV